jgi:hypothetical protein
LSTTGECCGNIDYDSHNNNSRKDNNNKTQQQQQKQQHQPQNCTMHQAGGRWVCIYSYKMYYDDERGLAVEMKGGWCFVVAKFV